MYAYPHGAHALNGRVTIERRLALGLLWSLCYELLYYAKSFFPHFSVIVLLIFLFSSLLFFSPSVSSYY